MYIFILLTPLKFIFNKTNNRLKEIKRKKIARNILKKFHILNFISGLAFLHEIFGEFANFFETYLKIR